MNTPEGREESLRNKQRQDKKDEMRADAQLMDDIRARKQARKGVRSQLGTWRRVPRLTIGGMRGGRKARKGKRGKSRRASK